jgi:foldase protein PrsA
LAAALLLPLSACSDAAAVASVGGRSISAAEFKYYLESAKATILQEAQATADTDEFWQNTEIDGKKASEIAKERALDEAVRVEILNLLARKDGIKVPANVSSSISAQAKSTTDEQITSLKTVTGMKTAQVRDFITKNYLASQENQSIAGLSSMQPSDAEAQTLYEEKYIRVKHILFLTQNQETQEPLPEEETAAKKKQAEDTLAKIKAGGDFDALMNELSEDTGLASYPDGYTFTKPSGMVQPFEDAAFALEVDGVSDLVETDYGYHILKRYPLLEGDAAAAEMTAVKNQAAQDKIKAFLDEKKNEYKLTVNQKNLDAIEVKAAPTPEPAPEPEAGELTDEFAGDFASEGEIPLEPLPEDEPALVAPQPESETSAAPAQ